ncbi:monoamine oxidase [Tistlia consotensis]|uniref:Tryptophan 2-monooxygenase n=1 Tax=Tistlia consotensis USBA 355 TaxID=560819 RepID=A0A1Y6BMB9_9PROT|nr:NAD(P)/FAD-dependent oxidoreductase [Tistlia consotensis]SMF10062.1 monoamine oxidase [Tistlia consotensis USBA 355]SNR34029.1 monoamine oxidase [Tistlia consotensis]
MTVDVAIVGAGAAGLGAAGRLAEAGRSVVVLEARDRVGGRAHVVQTAEGWPIDKGCHWLHSASKNPFVALAERRGFAVDRCEQLWARDWTRKVLGEAAYELEATWEELFEAAEAAERSGRDASLSALLPDGARFKPHVAAAIGWIWGGALDAVSATDHVRSLETMENWRLPAGYGSFVADLATDLPVELGRAVERLERLPSGVRLSGAWGSLEAAAAIVAVPLSILQQGRIAFAPGLPAAQAAALEGLRLGSDNKIYFRFPTEPGRDPFGGERDFQTNSRYDSERAAHIHVAPFGRALVEVYVGGPLSRELEAAGSGAMVAYGREALAECFGSRVGPDLEPVLTTGWDADPFSLGAYSHALPGRADDRRTLAARFDERLALAGEHTNDVFPACAHGAWLSGRRAAEQLLESVPAA